MTDSNDAVFYQLPAVMPVPHRPQQAFRSSPGDEGWDEEIQQSVDEIFRWASEMHSSIYDNYIPQADRIENMVMVGETLAERPDAIGSRRFFYHRPNAVLYIDVRYGGVNSWNIVFSSDASIVELDTTNFDKILSSSDSDLQVAMETIDDHIHEAVEITVDTGSFSNLLGSTDDDVQHALDTIDDLTHADLPDAGTYDHAAIDSHIDDASIHFTDVFVHHDGTTELTGDWGVGDTYGISELPFIDWTTSYVGGHQEARMHWNDDDGCLNVGMSGGVELQVGQENIIKCRNTTVSQIDNGTAVKITGAQSNRPTIEPATTANPWDGYSVVGLATEDIAASSNGYVTTLGLVRDVDTDSWNEGDALYLSNVTPGALTSVYPTPPEIAVHVGVVIRKHATEGIILVDVSTVPPLTLLADTFGTPSSDGDIYVWDQTGDQRFEIQNLNDTIEDFFNGTFLESFNAVATSDGATVTMSLEKSGGGDLTMRFSDGRTTLDCTPAATIALTAGSDSSPTTNFIYIPQSTKVLTKSTAGWPSAEHIKVGFFFVPSATEVQAEGTFINQNWNDHRAGTDGQGHLAHIATNIRLGQGGANWDSGVEPNATGAEYLEIVGAAPSAVYFKSTSGVAQQMHPHTIPAIDMSGTDDCHVVNWNGDAYHEVSDLADIVDDAAGVSLSNKYFNLVFWGVANKGGEYSPLMCNLPTGSYNIEDSALVDASGYDVTAIPREFVHDSSTGFLICRVTCRQNAAGTWTISGTKDLRGVPAGASAGSAAAGGVLTTFADNLFSIYNASDVTKIVDWDLSGITPGNTRTITPADADMTLLSTTDYTDLTDGGATTLHKHDHGGMDGLGDDDHTQYLLADGTRALTANWDAGNYKITALEISTDTISAETTEVAIDDSNFAIYNGANKQYGFGKAGDVEFFTDSAGGFYIKDAGVNTQHSLLSSGNVALCQQGGDVTIGAAAASNLYLDGTSDPSVYLREGGDTSNYGRIVDTGSNLYIRHYDAGASATYIEPIVGDGTSAATTGYFRNTNTSGTRSVVCYLGDGTATAQHTINAGTGDVDLCQQGGQVTVGGTGGAQKLTVATGNLGVSDGVAYLTKDGNVTGFVATSYRDAVNHVLNDAYAARGSEATPTAIANADRMLMFRSFGYDGDSNEVSAEFYSKVTNTVSDGVVPSAWEFTATDNSGSKGIVASLGGENHESQFGDLPSGDYVTLGPYGVILPYLSAAPATLTNGLIWMESDGLHIYYAGAEKVVAGA
jgi:hypothetical protein